MAAPEPRCVGARGEQSRIEQLVAPARSPLQETEPEPLASLSPELAKLLAALSPRQLGALRLTLLEGLSLSLVAEHLGVAPATVHQARQRALAALRQRLVGSGMGAPPGGAEPRAHDG
jgi:RNA polymerase sigma factor (sigma-70 family)